MAAATEFPYSEITVACTNLTETLNFLREKYHNFFLIVTV